MTVKSERRTQSRKRPLSLVYVELPPANGGMMRDLSAHGFSLRAMMPLRSSDKISFSFALDGAARIEGEAVVVRVEEDGKLAALEFAGLSGSARDRIHRWLEEDEAPVTPEPRPSKPAQATEPTFDDLRTEIRNTGPRPASSPTRGAERRTPAVGAPAEPERASPPISQSVVIPPATPPAVKLASVRAEFVATPEKIDTPEPPLEGGSADVSRPSIAALFPEIGPPAPDPENEAPVAADSSAPHEPAFRQTAVVAPALEPLSSFEADTDETKPGWMERFTIASAVGIMVFLALVAGSVVYHRELGHALIWLGEKIAGEEAPETSQLAKPSVEPSASAPALRPAEQAPSAGKGQEPPPRDAVSSGSNEPASDTRAAALPSARPNTPAPQLKDSSPSSLLPLTQVTRPSGNPPVPGDATADVGQPEYLQAIQILRTPAREGDLPEAIRLLWVAVEKGNIGAEIALADLFRQGRGVARNCDQARILLSTAARKGSAEAQKRLAALQAEGCEN